MKTIIKNIIGLLLIQASLQTYSFPHTKSSSQSSKEQNRLAFYNPVVIYYGISEYQPSDNDRAQIIEKVTDLKDQQSVSFVIEGYTDPSGSESYNQKLSEKRIEGIKEILISLGIPDSRIMEKAFGESKSFTTKSSDFHTMRKVEIKAIFMIK